MLFFGYQRILSVSLERDDAYKSKKLQFCGFNTRKEI